MGKKYIHQWILEAKRESFCNETGERIAAGENILYIPKGKDAPSQVYSSKSKAYLSAISPEEHHHTGYKTSV